MTVQLTLSKWLPIATTGKRAHAKTCTISPLSRKNYAGTYEENGKFSFFDFSHLYIVHFSFHFSAVGWLPNAWTRRALVERRFGKMAKCWMCSIEFQFDRCVRSLMRSCDSLERRESWYHIIKPTAQPNSASPRKSNEFDFILFFTKRETKSNRIHTRSILHCPGKTKRWLTMFVLAATCRMLIWYNWRGGKARFQALDREFVCGAT